MPQPRRFASTSLLLPLALGALGLSSTVACSAFAVLTLDEKSSSINDETIPPHGSGGATPWEASASSGTGQGGGGGASQGVGGNGSFAYLCGGSAAMCTPGTDDCAQGGDPNMGGDSPDGSKLACQLTATSGTVEAKCGIAGDYDVGDICTSAADCRAGLGCVSTPNGGQCRPYCCGDVDDCPDNSYCIPQYMYEGPAKIPVCAPATNCVLLDDSTCLNGQTCTIVRDDGTTSCVDPGQGTTDQDCPCAAGYYCSPTSGTCLKLCHTINPDPQECGPNGDCQGGVDGAYPDGFGTCVMY
jgi:hypothetical protein